MDHDAHKPRESHPCFVQPADTNSSVWRYMDLWKFGAMLASSGLWMSRLDVLRDADPYEGTVPRSYAEELARLERAQDAWLAEQGIDIKAYYAASPRIEAPGLFETYTGLLFANCWSLSAHESDALWRIYCRDSGGVAVRSTYAALANAIPPHYEIGLVRYIDHGTERLRRLNAYEPAMNKRAAFEYEREVRVIRSLSFENPKREEVAKGYARRVNLAQLITEARISPYSPPGYMERVRSLVDRFGYSFSVSPSEMSLPPVRDTVLIVDPAAQKRRRERDDLIAALTFPLMGGGSDDGRATE